MSASEVVPPPGGSSDYGSGPTLGSGGDRLALRYQQSKRIVQAIEGVFACLDVVSDDPVVLDVVKRAILNRYGLSPERQRLGALR